MLESQAQNLYVYRSPVSSGPSWGGFYPLSDAKVELIEHNDFSKPARCVLSFDGYRWSDQCGLNYGDRIRVQSARGSKVFEGYVTGFPSSFSGGSERQAGFERCQAVALSYIWFLSKEPVYGQLGRSQDDYTDFGLETQSPIDNAYTAYKGRICIFNDDGYPNMDPDSFNGDFDCRLFGPRQTAEFWTARDMILHVLNVFAHHDSDYLPGLFPATALSLAGLNNSDFDKVVHNICVEGLSVAEAIELICRNVGWAFKEVFTSSGMDLCFYKPARASSTMRSSSSPVIRHSLWAPNVGEDISFAAQTGQKLLFAMDINESIAPLINNPWGLGDVYKFEITAELVPGWKDDDLVPDTENLYFTDAELMAEDNPDIYDFYKYYHQRGSSFKPSVGRLWVLNETGRFSELPFDRGPAFDFSTVLPAEHAFSGGKRTFGPFARRFLNPISIYEHTYQSLPIKVEFSFDGGTTWLPIPANIVNCRDQCGIIISQPNLHEILPPGEAGIASGGSIDGELLSYWTSLCDDKLAGRVWKDDQWKTRVRVTAQVAMDQRINRQEAPSPQSGSPLWQSGIFDFSDKYDLKIRTESSVYAVGGHTFTNETDCIARMNDHLGLIHSVNQDRSISGRFTLAKLWLDGSYRLPFEVGDIIENISGRDYSLKSNIGPASVYPEIIQVIYMPRVQKMILITRDMRYAVEGEA
jgi:hypothetical protein